MEGYYKMMHPPVSLPLNQLASVASKACPWGLDVGQTEQVYISGIAVSWLIIFMCILRPLK